MAEPEMWLRGAVPDVPALFQPVAHSLLQCLEEVRETLPAVPPNEIWARRGDSAAVGYHVRHAIGSLDRLLTYARGEPLSAEQLATMRAESDASLAPRTAGELMVAFERAVHGALEQVKGTTDSSAFAHRAVGRELLPSTVMGLLFHAAEHTQRHVGQMTTLVRVAGSL